MTTTNRINSHFYQIAVSDVDDNVWGIKADVANVLIYGGNIGEVLTTDGTGNLSWALGGATANAIPTIEWVSTAAANNQTFSNTVLAAYLSNSYLADVFVNGVKQVVADYDITGNTLTLNTFVKAGEQISVGAGVTTGNYVITTPIQPIIEWTAPVAANNQTFTDANLATFTDNTYAAVYLNGVFQRPQDYVISGTTLTVNTLLTAGTVVSVGPTGTSTSGGGGSGVTQIVAGTGISVSPIGGTGVVTINATGSGTGTVTNIATSTVDTGGLGFTLTGGPITTSGTVTLTVPPLATLQTALGLGNIAYSNYNGNGLQVLGGGGVWVTANTGTVTSIATSGSGLGFSLSGGTITTTGTVTLATPTDTALRTSLNIGNVANTNYNGNGLQVLAGNGSWVAQTGGVTQIIAGTNVTISPIGGTGAVTINSAGATPSGANTEIQFNNAGVFGASANLTYSTATGATSVANLLMADYQETVAASVNTGAAITPDFNAATIFRYTANSNFTFNGFANPTAGKNAIVVIQQDAIGGRIMTSTMKFAGGLKVLSTFANAIDTIAVFYDGTNYYASLITGYA
jgi:hypothetical protein